MNFLEPVYQGHAVRFNPQNQQYVQQFKIIYIIDCFEDKIASITGMLTFSIVNTENFSLIPLYHPESEASL